MNRALVVHFLGFYALNALMPTWALSADADILSVWYASFALVDLMALISLGRAVSLLQRIAHFTLLVSMAWSACLSVEMIMLQDLLQQADTSMQRYFDIILGLALMSGAIQNHLFMSAKKA